jgi:eukaryotic-like serine/threonine-protein kinase
LVHNRADSFRKAETKAGLDELDDELKTVDLESVMSIERWRQFKVSSRTPWKPEPAQRRAFPADACEGGADLLREGEASVNPSVAASTVAPMNGPDWLVNTSPSTVAPDRALPAKVGRYRILRVLGEGGMGVVYEAEQQYPRRIVALKLMQPGVATAELLRRFEHESRVLGRLQHPGIAQIYEAGTADAGFGPQPYFAMEFVRGQSLCDYAQALHLNVPQRLELIIKICDAVQHAHQRGVIHRDLKPGNILVDAEGQPKVLDFGVARSTDSDAYATRQTDLGQLLGTLAYMSPEQVFGDPLELDTRSDVYTLGVILYELLAGRLPYQVSNKLHEAVRTIREEDAVRLSSISRAYRGDLETIVSKTLEKDKGRRYASPADLAADIRRHLQDEPIVGRHASTAYQLSKFGRRNRALVAGVGAVFVVLVGGIVASAWQAARATQARKTALLERDRATTAEERANKERDRALNAERAATAAEVQALRDRNQALAENERADTEAATAKAVNDFLQNDLLAQASQVAVLGGRGGKPDPDLKVRMALDRAATGIKGKFESQPLVEASIRRTMGLAYYGLGLYPEAQRQMERATDLRQRVLGANDRGTLDTMSYLADTYREQGKYGQAEALFTKVVSAQTHVLGKEHPDTLSSKNNLALVYLDEGKFAPAADLLANNVEVSRRVRGETSPETLDDMNNLAILYGFLGRFDQAEQLNITLLNANRRLFGEENPRTLNTMSNLADVYRAEGKYAQAEPLVTKAVEVRRRLLGEQHPETLMSKSLLGLLYRNEGKFAQAEPLFIEVVEGRRRLLGDEHLETLKSTTYLADLYRNQGKDAPAEALYTKALDTLRRLPVGQDHPNTFNTMNNLALLYLGQGKYAQAEALFTQALEGRRRVLGPDHPGTASTLASLGRLSLQQDKYTAAEALLREALKYQEKANAEGWERYNSQSLLGASMLGQRRYSEAEPLLLAGYQGIVEHETTIPYESRPVADQAAARVVQLYQDWGKTEKAAEWQKYVQARRAADRREQE